MIYENMTQLMQNIVVNQTSTEKKIEDKDISTTEDLPARQVRRSLTRELPSLSTPITAARRTAVLQSNTPIDTRLPPISQLSSLDEHDDISGGMNGGIMMDNSVLVALQKGMAKPPFFDGSLADSSENILTWWRQVGNYAKAFPIEVQASLIKTFLRGSAALWLDSRERELGRSLTIQELADGLTQEYASETTSLAALQKLESLNMGTEGCNTIGAYNAMFHKYYNQCSLRTRV